MHDTRRRSYRRWLALPLLLLLLGAPMLPVTGGATSRALADPDWDRLRQQRETTGAGLRQNAALRHSILSELFRLQLTADAAQARAAQLQREMARSVRQAEANSARLHELGSRQAELQARMTARLRYYRQNGHVGYLDVLLGSHSLDDFLRRAALIQRVLQADAGVLADLQTVGDALEWQENRQLRLALSYSQMQEQIEQAAGTSKAALAAQQQVLDDLALQADAYQAELARLHTIWTQGGQQELARFGQAFAGLRNHADLLQPDHVAFHLFPASATITLREETLTTFLHTEADLQGLAVRLTGDALELQGTLGGVPLILRGRLTAGSTTLSYDLQRVDFAGFPLPPEALAHLQQSGKLTFDLGAFLPMGWRITSLQQQPGSLQAAASERD